MPKWTLPSDEELDAQIEASRGKHPDEPSAKEVRYDAGSRRVVLELSNGTTFIVPVELIQDLQEATEDDLADVRLLGSGFAIAWNRLNADALISNLLMGVFGTQRWMSELGKTGGKSTSEAKKAAARMNGKKGGRPRKAAT